MGSVAEVVTTGVTDSSAYLVITRNIIIAPVQIQIFFYEYIEEHNLHFYELNRFLTCLLCFLSPASLSHPPPASLSGI